MSSQSSFPEAPAATTVLEPTFENNLRVMGRVVYGLMLRESRTRYGTSDLGYLWAVIDPAIQMGVLWLVYIVIGRIVPLPTSMPVFLVTGILPYMFWRNCTIRGGSAAAANLALLTYPQVKVFDVVIARVMLDLITLVVVTLIFVFVLRFATGQQFSSWVRDPIVLAGGVSTLFFFSLCTSIFSSSLARVWRAWPQVFSYLARPLYFTSGIFFTLESLPTNFRSLAMYNPLAHMLEWIRTGAVPGFISTLYDPLYIYTWGFILLFIGLVIDWVLRLTGHSEESH
jgi:capsular polysaccharide transport system permease protein